ncbi:Immediate early response 3-interacting protein 1 [Vanrija albida]|uniref:Immediate early response 3-interacting protein 1 n=1 Tax=Vanrija albida TaxID=181172 RepID=A0ABR3QE70_9TREE
MLGFLGNVFYAALLLTNAIAILNEERFLAKIGWSAKAPAAANSGFGAAPDAYGGGVGFDTPEGVSLKAKVVNLISAVRTLMRLPLIVVNAFVILYLIIIP